MLALAAKRAIEQFFPGAFIRHRRLLNLQLASTRLVKHLVHQAVLHRFLAAHEIVPVSIAVYGFHGLAGVLGEHFIQAAFQVKDFLGVDFDVRSLSLKPPRG